MAIDSLLRATRKKEDKDSAASPILSIVDAYNIIKPRTMLNVDLETICSFHFLCREPNKHVSNPNVVTPAGLAYLSQIVQALKRLL